VLLAAGLLFVACAAATAGTQTGVTSVWPVFRHDLQRTGRSDRVGPLAPSTPKWVFVAEEYMPDVNHAIDSSPCIASDGTIYVGDHGGILWALNPEDGKPRWFFDAKGAIAWASPSVGPDGTIYFGTFASNTPDGGGRLYAVSRDGGYRWHFPFPGTQLDSPPTIGPDGALYIAAFDGALHSLVVSSNTPYLRWSSPLSTSSQVVSSPAFSHDGSRLYIGTLDGELVAVSLLDGSVVWRAALDAEVYATPAVGKDGTVFVGTFAGSMYAVNPSGDVVWQCTPTDAGEIKASPAVGPDSTVYFATRNGRLYRLNPKDGSVIWTWQSETGGRINSSPVVDANGNAYFGAEDGFVYAVGADGRLLWRYDVGSAYGNIVNSSPAIGADGTLYVGTQHGTVYAFSSTASIAYGDIDGDGRVSVKDVTLVLGYVLAGRPLLPSQLKAADVAPAGAPDGKLTIGDAVRILRRALGIEPDPWP